MEQESLSNYQRDKRKVTLISFSLFLLVLGAFMCAVSGDFITLDDPVYVTQNFHVRSGLTSENIQWAFRNADAGNWFPLTWLSHMLDCELFGLNPHGHHATSVVLHAVNSVFLFLLLYRMTGAVWRSCFLAALFALHPLRVESVVWIAERKDVLSTTFWMLTLLAYTRFVQSASKRGLYYALSVVFFILGLMSKSMLVTLPCVMLLLDYWPLDRYKTSKSFLTIFVEKIPFFLATIVVSVITFSVQQSAGAMAKGLSLPARVGNALIAYCEYLGKFFWPLNLSIVYPHANELSHIAVFLCGILLLGISALTVISRKKRPYLFVGWFWFVGTLVPVIGLVQVGSQAFADRYTYIPIIGLQLLLIWGFCDLNQLWKLSNFSVSIAGSCVVAACTFLTVRQIGFWKTNESLFRHALAITENNYVAHYCLGISLTEKRDSDAAIEQYRAALKANPLYGDAHTALGYELMQKGDLEGSIAEHETALRLRPNFPTGHYLLGMALDRASRRTEAITQYQEALKLKPAFPEVHYLLGVALDQTGKSDEAMTHYREAIRLKPDYAEAHNELGVALGRKGNLDEAILHYQDAVRVQPKSADLHYNLGNALIRRHRLDEAIEQLSEAIRLQPSNAEAHNNLGIALTGKKRLDDAVEQFKNALELKPDFGEARKNLEIAQRMKGSAATNSPNRQAPQ
jgi:tetratricopeptide (TPR) repeat protein